MKKEEWMLIKILEPYTSSGPEDTSTEEYVKGNERAKKALYLFYETLRKYPVSKKYENDSIHTQYIFYLLLLRRELEAQNYMEACYELLKLMHFTPIAQPRICYNVLKLLEQYLKIGSEESV